MKDRRLAAFRGVGVALVTPFLNGEIDPTGIARLVRHVTDGGVDFWWPWAPQAKQAPHPKPSKGKYWIK